MADRTPELADTLVEGLYDGTPLRQLCRENGISKSAVYRWFDDNAELAGRIARAREHGYHQIADQCIEIADDQDEDHASRKVRIDTRLKLLAKWDPKRYGDKTLIGSDPDNPLPSGLQISFVRPGENETDEGGLRLLATPPAAASVEIAESAAPFDRVAYQREYMRNRRARAKG